jgi:hypothetical protein
MLTHYEYNLDKYQQCPTPLAVGPKGTGKTTASKVFLSIVGLQRKNLVGKMTEVEAATHCSKSSFPYVYDDPDNVAEVKRLINSTFNGQLRVTSKECHAPRTGCMFTINQGRLARLLTDFQ